MKDLIVLVADKDMEYTVKGLLSRTISLNIREIVCDIKKIDDHDSGFKKSHELLRPILKQYKFALVMFDKEGCGQTEKTREQLEESVNSELVKSGWKDRCETIVIEPELENWVWSDSPEVSRCLGWKDEKINLRDWLNEEKLWSEDEIKPEQPKEVMQIVLRKVDKKWSSKIFKDLAGKVSLMECKDASFIKFKRTLQKWFKKKNQLF